MATGLSFSSVTPTLHPHHRNLISRPNTHGGVYKFRCSGQNSTSNSSTKPDTEPQNVLLKMAWYSSELLGIAASFFRSPENVGTSGAGLELSVDGSGAIDRAVVVDAIKEDFQRIRESAIGALVVFCPSLGSPFFRLLGIQNTIWMHKLEKYAGMWSTGMFRKWPYLSKF